MRSTPPEPLPTPAAPLPRATAPKRPHATYERGLWWLTVAAGLVLMISSTAATVDWFLLDAMAPRAAFRAVRTATNVLGLVVVVFQMAGLWCLRGQNRVRSLVFTTMATLVLLRAAGPLLDVAGWAGSVGAIIVMQALGLLARACLVAVLLRLAAGRLPGVLHALHAISRWLRPSPSCCSPSAASRSGPAPDPERGPSTASTCTPRWRRTSARDSSLVEDDTFF